MTQSSDKKNYFRSNLINATSIDLQTYLTACLNLLPASTRTGSEVLFSPKMSVIPDHDRAAAVLVPFLKVHNEWHILMTKRAAHLVHHAGQISFPGGKVEAIDSGPESAALREASEEIHLAPDWVQILGGLDEVRSPAGFLVQPIVGIVSGENRLKDLAVNPKEVDLIFTLPISHLVNPKNFRLVSRETDGRHKSYWVIEHHEHFIWGLSARILVDLYQRFDLLTETEI